MTQHRPRVTRRRFLEALGGIGGAAAVYHGMATLGLLRVPRAHAGTPTLPSDLGAGKKVIVIGAGLAGLCSAYLLARAGFEVKIIEANTHIGGRSLTLRPGDSFQEAGDDAPLQTCKFDEGKGLYLNAGPGRIPHHHTAVLNYCREFGVAMEPFIFASRANLVQGDGFWKGEPVQLRRLKHDSRGHVAEMMAKASDCKLDEALSSENWDAFCGMLKDFGALEEEASQGMKSLVYNGTNRAGYKIRPGAGLDEGERWPPFDLQEIVDSRIWDTGLYSDMRYYWQASLLQPKGGMDMIVKAFRAAKIPGARTIDNLIVTGSPVEQIRNTEGGVEVLHAKGSEGADFCISTMAPPLLARVQRDFDSNFVKVLDRVDYFAACKVGWQAKYRFWEAERTRIFGGISWTAHEISQIWYPSDGFYSDTGVLTGAYNRGEPAEKFGDYPHEKRLQVALEGGEKLHRGFADLVHRDRGISIAWQHMPHIYGGWAAETAEQDPKTYRELNERLPEGRVYLAGDYLSYMPGWQEGAVLSAEMAVSDIAERVKQSAN